MKKSLFILAAAGWTISLTVHLFTIAGIDVQSRIPLIIVMHFGVFVVWVPAILETRKRFPQNSANARPLMRTPFSTFKLFFANSPRWMTAIAVAGLLYAFVSFFLITFITRGAPAIENGQYVLQAHGQSIKTLTEHEYHWYKAQELRLFSAYWIAFYGLAAAALFRTDQAKPASLGVR